MRIRCFICTIYNMSGRVVSDIQTRAEGESFYIRYNTDAHVVNDSSYEFIVEVILKINVVKVKVKVYVNQHESVSHIQTPSRP